MQAIQRQMALRDLLKSHPLISNNGNNSRTPIHHQGEYQKQYPRGQVSGNRGQVGLFKVLLNNSEMRYGVWYVSSITCEEETYIAWISRPISGRERIGNFKDLDGYNVELYTLRNSELGQQLRNATLRYLLASGVDERLGFATIFENLIGSQSGQGNLGDYMKLLVYLSIIKPSNGNKQIDIAKLLEESISIETDVPISDQIQKRLSSLMKDLHVYNNLPTPLDQEQISIQDAIDGAIAILFVRK